MENNFLDSLTKAELQAMSLLPINKNIEITTVTNLKQDALLKEYFHPPATVQESLAENSPKNVELPLRANVCSAKYLQQEMFLTTEELVVFTRKQTRPAQKRALSFMGIDYRERPDGSVAVLKTHVEKQLNGSMSDAIKRKPTQPNWGAMHV